MIVNNNIPLTEYTVTSALNYRVQVANNTQPSNNGPNGAPQAYYNPRDPVRMYRDELYKTKRSIMAGEIYSKYSPDGGRPFWDWQQDLVNDLYSGDNAFVAIKAGGGKTTPCISFWLNKYLLNINNPSHGFVSYYLNDRDKHEIETHIGTPKALAYRKLMYNLLYGNIISPLRDNTGKPIASSNSTNNNVGIVFITPIKVLSNEQANGFAQVLADLFLYLNDDIERVINTYLIDINRFRNPNEKRMCIDILKYIFDEMNKVSVPSKDDIEKICYNYTMHHTLNNFEISILNDIIYNKIDLIEKMGGKENILFRYIDYLNNFAKELLNKPTISPFFNERFFGNGGKFLDICKEHIHRTLISVLTGGESDTYNTITNRADKSLAVIATYEKLANNPDIVRNSKVIVFDEAHMYQPASMSSTGNYNDTMKAMDCMYKILKACNPSNTQVIFLSGTINPNSAKNLVEDIKSKVPGFKSKDFKIVANDTGGNPSNIHIIPDDMLLNVRDVINTATSMIKHKNGHNCFIYFSKKQILNICTEIMNRVDNVGLKNIEKGREDWTKYTVGNSNNYNGIGRFEGPSRSEIINNSLLKIPEAQNIKNQFLRQVVAHGFGYIISNDTKDPYDERLGKITEEDKMIVAKLFSEGKIYVLFATSAIGIGVNVDIYNLYLPNLETYIQGKLLSPEKRIIDMRTLNQLINRTGRGKIDNATVHTPRGNVAYVEKIVQMNTDEYADIPRFYK